jgi:drug/metabolite transporter (DMT)-like permease
VGLRRHNADILLLGVALVWGSSYLATKVLTLHGTVFAILALRFLIAAIVMVVVWVLSRERTGEERLGRCGLLVALTVGGTQALILSLETWGVSLTSATNAGLIISMTIVFTPHWSPFGFAAGCRALISSPPPSPSWGSPCSSRVRAGMLPRLVMC